MHSLLVTPVAFTAAPPLAVADGLLGWSVVTINHVIVVRDVAIRRTLDGRYVVSFPAPALRRGRGRRRALVHPIYRATHAEIERQVIAKLHWQGWLAS